MKNLNLIIPENLTLQAESKKSVFEMTAEEFAEAGKKIVEIAKNNAFPKGLPIIVGENGKTYGVYPDGRRKRITPQEDPNQDWKEYLDSLPFEPS